MLSWEANWISGKRKDQKLSEILVIGDVDVSLHLVPKVTACQKANHRGKFPKFAHFRQHMPTTTQRGKRPFGLFSRLDIRRGIPVCPCELENTLTWERITEQPWMCFGHKQGRQLPGEEGTLPCPSVSLQHAGLIKLSYQCGIACSERLYQARHFPAACSCPSRKGAAPLPAWCMPAVTTLTTKHVFILLSC